MNGHLNLDIRLESLNIDDDIRHPIAKRLESNACSKAPVFEIGDKWDIQFAASGVPNWHCK